MNSVALIIIYNHKFDRNIPVLEGLYGDRFKNIFHLVPFYTGDNPNVIPVYENSFYFQGYIAQGLKHYYAESFSHYLFIADDMVLNPIINEHNYVSHFMLQGNACFFPVYNSLYELNKPSNRWERVVEAFHFKPNNIWGLEAVNEIPGFDEAKKMFEDHGLKVGTLSYSQIHTRPEKPKWNDLKNRRKYYKERLRMWKYGKKTFNSYYPLAGGYSDIFLISSTVMKKFAHYCGVFAVNKLFVEFAIPTALIFSADKIINENELLLRGTPLWTKEELSLLDKYDYSLEKLVAEFPPGFLYLHPVKLSKWKI